MLYFITQNPHNFPGRLRNGINNRRHDRHKTRLAHFNDLRRILSKERKQCILISMGDFNQYLIKVDMHNQN